VCFKRLYTAQSTRHQRALFLELLDGLRGVPMSEKGRLPRASKQRTAAEKERRAMQQQPQRYTDEVRQKSPDLGGVADMFAWTFSFFLPYSCLFFSYIFRLKCIYCSVGYWQTPDLWLYLCIKIFFLPNSTMRNRRPPKLWMIWRTGVSLDLVFHSHFVCVYPDMYTPGSVSGFSPIALALAYNRLTSQFK